MAAVSGRSDRALTDQIRVAPTSFDYYQLVRLLRAARRGSSDTAVRFRADTSAAFPGHEVSRVADGRDGAEVVTPNYGIAGPVGPLPDAYTEWLRERMARGDRAMADFLDLFNHRVNVLRYRIKARTRLSLSTDAPEDTAMAGYLGAVLGLQDPPSTDALPLPRRALLALAGLLADRRRSAVAVQKVLGAFLDAPVVIEQFVGAWQALPADTQTRLMRSNSRLGVNTLLGSRAWNAEARIRITVGPLPHARFLALLPGGESHASLVALLRFLTERAVDCVVCLRADPATVPPPRCESDRHRSAALRLGYTAWSGSIPAAPQAEFLVRAFEPAEAA